MKIPFKGSYIINEEISTYFARHSFIKRLHELGTSDYTMKNIVGHENFKSTQGYIGTKSDERIKELNIMLLSV